MSICSFGRVEAYQRKSLYTLADILEHLEDALKFAQSQPLVINLLEVLLERRPERALECVADDCVGCDLVRLHILSQTCHVRSPLYRKCHFTNYIEKKFDQMKIRSKLQSTFKLPCVLQTMKFRSIELKKTSKYLQVALSVDPEVRVQEELMRNLLIGHRPQQARNTVRCS